MNSHTHIHHAQHLIGGPHHDVSFASLSHKALVAIDNPWHHFGMFLAVIIIALLLFALLREILPSLSFTFKSEPSLEKLIAEYEQRPQFRVGKGGS